MAQVHYALKPSSVSAELGRWSLNGRVDSCEWDGEFVVRADALGVTCLLSALAGETLAALRGGPLHIDEITARVFRDSVRPSAATASLAAAFAEDGGDTQAVLSVLVELKALGLVRADLD